MSAEEEFLAGIQITALEVRVLVDGLFNHPSPPHYDEALCGARMSVGLKLMMADGALAGAAQHKAQTPVAQHEAQTPVADDPRLSLRVVPWVIARRPSTGEILLGGLGAMGVGRRWVAEEEDDKGYRGYAEAVIVDGDPAEDWEDPGVREGEVRASLSDRPLAHEPLTIWQDGRAALLAVVILLVLIVAFGWHL